MSPRDAWNARRYAADGRGHYESWFLRANDPQRPRAFWIRYTIFAPRGRPEDAEGELWAMLFDGESDRVIARKREVPISRCTFSDSSLSVDIEDATLTDGAARGSAEDLRWDLSYAADAPPLLLLPPARYDSAFPKAKSVVPAPLARFRGTVQIGDETVNVDDWVGSQNHNWGSQHTDRYAWGQVSGFDEEPDAFVECITARVRIGPLQTPWVTLATLRIGGEEHTFSSMLRGALATTRLDYFDWEFDVGNGKSRLIGRFEAPRDSFLGLRYRNPPGGVKTCLNTKIARVSMTLETAQGIRRLGSAHRGAFEILTDDRAHGLTPVR